MEHKSSLMANNIARRAHILCFNAVQEETAIFLSIYTLFVLSACVSRMHRSKRRNLSFLENIAGNWSDKECRNIFDYLGVYFNSFTNNINLNLTFKDNMLLGNPLLFNRGLPFAYGD